MGVWLLVHECVYGFGVRGYIVFVTSTCARRVPVRGTVGEYGLVYNPCERGYAHGIPETVNMIVV